MTTVTKEDLQKLPSAFLADNSTYFESVVSQEIITPQSQNKEGGMFLSTQGFVSNNVRNVREFGDAGTGVDATTNTATLQAAFDAVTADGDTLYVGSGTYSINSTINVTGRFQLKGTDDRSVFSWVGVAGGVMFSISDPIWLMENIEFQAPGANKPLHFIDQTVLVAFCTLRDIYFADETTGAAVLFGLGWRNIKTEGVLFNACFQGFGLVVVSEMSSNIAMLTMDNTIWGDGGVQTGSVLAVTDTIGGDIGIIVLNGFQYVVNTEPLADSAIVAIDEDAAGPFATVIMENIQVFGTFSKTLAHYLLFVEKSTPITNIFRFDMKRILILNGGVTLDSHIGGDFPPHVLFPKESILHSASWFQTTDITLIDNQLHFRTPTSTPNKDVIRSSVEVEGNPRFRMEQQGDHFWGDGTGSGDVRLYRGGAGVLATDTSVRIGGRFRNNDLITLTNTATPSVALGNVFRTGGTTTITDFTGGLHTQGIIIKAEHTLTITHGASTINLQGDVNFDMVPGDNLTCFYDGVDWWENGRRT